MHIYQVCVTFIQINIESYFDRQIVKRMRIPRSEQHTHQYCSNICKRTSGFAQSLTYFVKITDRQREKMLIVLPVFLIFSSRNLSRWA